MATLVLKPLRHQWLWLGLWLLAIAMVIGVCLMPGADLPPMPRNIDKIEHALAFFILAASAVQLFKPGRALLPPSGSRMRWRERRTPVSRCAIKYRRPSWFR
jgi:hypothetical protein